MTKRILLVVAYDGTGYAGFQAQKSGVPTIEGELNRALKELTGEPVEVAGASRTDAGVHARCNLAVFDTESRIPPGKFSYALNVRLPEQIRVTCSLEVPGDFHPRFCSTVKTYEYRIYNAQMPDPMRRLYTYFSRYRFDVEAMRRAAVFLEGEHDFKSFCSTYTSAKTTVREVLSVEVEEERVSGTPGITEKTTSEKCGAPGECAPEPGSESREIVIRVRGRGFLYNMVRIIAGTLMEVGRGAKSPGEIPGILAACDRRAAGPTAPACGLTLVRYEIREPGMEMEFG
ncbi:MAG: tRNA pseudouridine(38-40) synthase TruA [Eubacteriales bacterium]|nr:tRNA pseudouridine(38-40) synthase TruA [Eubacteriales bacterium]